MSVRALHKQMERRYPDLRGTSYGGIRQYAEGKVRNPRIDLLRAIADVLEVRGDWLAFDEGAMTEEEERRRQAKQEAGGEESPPVSHDGEPGLSWADLIQVVQQSFLGKQSTRLQDDPMARVAVIEAIERLVPLLRALSSLSPWTALMEIPDDIPDTWTADYIVAISLGRVLRAPFEYAPYLFLDPVHYPGLHSEKDLRDYIVGVCQALHRLAEPHERIALQFQSALRPVEDPAASGENAPPEPTNPERKADG